MANDAADRSDRPPERRSDTVDHARQERNNLSDNRSGDHAASQDRAGGQRGTDERPRLSTSGSADRQRSPGEAERPRLTNERPETRHGSSTGERNIHDPDRPRIDGRTEKAAAVKAKDDASQAGGSPQSSDKLSRARERAQRLPEGAVRPTDTRWGGDPAAPTDAGNRPAGVRESKGASPLGDGYRSASAAKDAALKTAISPDVGESSAYQEALRRREIGIERPQGANRSGRGDFITAIEKGDKVRLVVSDVETSQNGQFSSDKAPSWSDKKSSHPKWDQRLRDAIAKGRLDLGDAKLEAKIREAYARGDVTLRHVKVDMSNTGQGRITGIDGGVVPGARDHAAPRTEKSGASGGLNPEQVRSTAQGDRSSRGVAPEKVQSTAQHQQRAESAEARGPAVSEQSRPTVSQHEATTQHSAATEHRPGAASGQREKTAPERRAQAVGEKPVGEIPGQQERPSASGLKPEVVAGFNAAQLAFDAANAAAGFLQAREFKREYDKNMNTAVPKLLEENPGQGVALIVNGVEGPSAPIGMRGPGARFDSMETHVFATKAEAMHYYKQELYETGSTHRLGMIWVAPTYSGAPKPTHPQ